MNKKTIILVLMLCSMILGHALAEKYNASDFYFEKLKPYDIVFKAGDTLSGKRIDIEIYYTDVDGKEIERTENGKVKSVVIDGEKVDEWRIVNISSAVIQMDRMIYKGAFGYTMKPAYAVADSEGYLSLLPNTYHLYTTNAQNKKVRFTGTVVEKVGQTSVLALSDNKYVAITAVDPFETNDKIVCKGMVVNYWEYLGNTIPVVECEEIKVQNYETLKVGDTGEEVVKMKKRLQNLGYFRAEADLSGTYNKTCAERVQAFQEKNGLNPTGVADNETLTLLYSEAAKAK